MAKVQNTLRTNLLSLFAWFGAMVLAVLVWNLALTISDHFRIRNELARGSEADILIRLSYDLRIEDMAVFQALSDEAPLVPPELAATATDVAVENAVASLSAHSDGDHQAAIAMLSSLRDQLDRNRTLISKALSGLPQARRSALARWRADLERAYPEVEGVTHDLIAEAGEPEARIAPNASLRFYVLFTFRSIISNRFLLEDALDADLDDPARLLDIARTAGQLRGAANLAEDQFLTESSPAFAAVAKATGILLRDYLPAETRALSDLVKGNATTASFIAWREASLNSVANLMAAEHALDAETDQLLAAAARQDLLAMALWTAAVVAVTVLLLQAVRLTLTRVVTPLEQLHSDLLRLAHDDFNVDLAPNGHLAEIQAMYDALVTFRENGLRRERMQAELARLTDRVVAANHAMTAELQAAALVQAAQLPPACDLRGARFDTFYRPSRMIAGDTYDFVTLEDGRTRIFQIDVSGHGAAAALVSVMSHIAVKSALEKAGPSEPLAEIVARVNRDWNEALPYFTMLLVEIDPQASIARVVQAGHPPLLRLPAVGGVETVGDGGMPVGALPWAEYEEVTCAFHPGDRLVLTTDGVTEAADHHGEQFGDARYLTLLHQIGPADVGTFFGAVDAALWDWCGTEAFDDDVTILVLEAKEPAYAH